MRVIRVEGENYGAFKGKHVFTLSDRGLTMVLGQNLDEPRMNSNGSAKSTIFESLDWCLFGVNPKGDHIDSIIHDECSFAEVTTYLYDEDMQRPLTVSRKKARNKSMQLFFWVGEQAEDNKTALDSKETQRLLNIELGLDRDVFHATVMYGQEDQFHLASAKGAARMEILTKIFPELGVLDQWLEKAKDRAATAKDDILKTEGMLNSIVSESQGIGHTSFDDQVAQWEHDRQSRIVALQERLRSGAVQVEEQRAALAQEQSARQALQALEAATPPAQVVDTELVKRLVDTENARSQTQMEFGRVNGDFDSLRSRILSIQSKQAGTCSECGQPVTVEHLQGELQKLRGQEAVAGQRVNELSKQVSSLSQTFAGLQDEQRQRQQQQSAHVIAHTRQVDQARSVVTGFQDIHTWLSKAGTLTTTLNHEIAELQAQTNPFHDRGRQVQERLQVLQKSQGEHETYLETLQNNLRYAEFWVEGFGTKGLKNYILDYKLQEMTDAANQWIQLLTGGTIWVRFETQKLGRSSKKLTNEITIRVFRYNRTGSITERNFASWSGGEKRRVSWAIDFGLSRLIAARATKRWDLLVLDEVFKYVDKSGGEAVVEMLQHLKKEKSSIFVIEHDADFQSHFESQILVRKENGASRIVENFDEQQRVQSDGQPRKGRKKKPARASVGDNLSATPRRKRRRRVTEDGVSSS